MSSESARERPMHLAALFDAAGLEQVLRSFADFHGVGVTLVDVDGLPTLSVPGPGRFCEVVRGAPAGEGRCGARLAEIRRSASASAAVLECFTGLRYVTWPLGAGGARLGAVVVGPYRPVDRPLALTGSTVAALAPGEHGGAEAALADEPVLADARARRIAEQIGRVVGLLAEGAIARHESARQHLAAMEAAYAELEDRNRRLAEMVERLREADRLKSSFLATVSHELRTPLTSVIGYSEMLLEGLAGALSEEQREYVATILDKGDQLLQLISAILDVSRVEAGTLRLASEPVNIADLVRAVLSAVEPLARRKRLALASPPETRAPRVLGDRDKIRQVLVNLLGNAIKFTPEGGRVELALEVGMLAREEAGPLALGSSTPSGPQGVGVRLHVRDTGIGIAKEKLGRIFEPFFQVDSSPTREYGGTGLGLAIVKSFVEAQGGRVWVESEPGRGSCFTVTLPAVQEDLTAYLDASNGLRAPPPEDGELPPRTRRRPS